jgi:hypothetical protein
VGNETISLYVEGEFPDQLAPDTIRVESEMGTYVLLKDGMKIGSGQLSVGVGDYTKREPSTGRLHSGGSN